MLNMFHRSSYFKRGFLDLLHIDAHGVQFLGGDWKSAGEAAADLHAYAGIDDWDMACNAIRDLHYGTVEHIDHGFVLQ